LSSINMCIVIRFDVEEPIVTAMTTAGREEDFETMAVSSELVERIRQHVGASTPPITATIDGLMSRRYARAIGDENPLYHDESYARARGYDGLVVPPNFLPSYLDWTDGGPEADLRADGTPTHEMEWIPLEGVRLMGGGEEMQFHRPVTAGNVVVFTSTLDEVSPRESKSGLMVVLRIRNEYATSTGIPLMTSMRTVLGR
jgi:acyl dehydratase